MVPRWRTFLNLKCKKTLGLHNYEKFIKLHRKVVSWWRVCDKHKSQLLVVFHQAWGVSSSVDIVCYFCCCCFSIVVAVFACSLMFEQYFSALVWVEEGAVSLRVHSGNFSTKTKYNSISCLIIYSSLTAWVHSGNFSPKIKYNFLLCLIIYTVGHNIL